MEQLAKATVLMDGSRYVLRDPDTGELAYFDNPKQARLALENGYDPAISKDEIRQSNLQKEYGTPLGQLKSAVVGYSNAMMFGLPEVGAALADKAFGTEMGREFENLRAANPFLSIAGEIGGVLTPTGAAKALGGLAARSGERIGERVAAKLANISKERTAGIVGRVVGKTAEGAALGAAYSAGPGLADAIEHTSNPSDFGTTLAKHLEYGMAFGGGLGAAGSLIGEAVGGLTKSAQKRSSLIDEQVKLKEKIKNINDGIYRDIESLTSESSPTRKVLFPEEEIALKQQIKSYEEQVKQSIRDPAVYEAERVKVDTYRELEKKLALAKADREQNLIGKEFRTPEMGNEVEAHAENLIRLRYENPNLPLIEDRLSAIETAFSKAKDKALKEIGKNAKQDAGVPERLAHLRKALTRSEIDKKRLALIKELKKPEQWPATFEALEEKAGFSGYGDIGKEAIKSEGKLRAKGALGEWGTVGDILERYKSKSEGFTTYSTKVERLNQEIAQLQNQINKIASPKQIIEMEARLGRQEISSGLQTKLNELRAKLDTSEIAKAHVKQISSGGKDYQEAINKLAEINEQLGGKQTNFLNRVMTRASSFAMTRYGAQGMGGYSRKFLGPANIQSIMATATASELAKTLSPRVMALLNMTVTPAGAMGKGIAKLGKPLQLSSTYVGAKSFGEVSKRVEAMDLDEIGSIAEASAVHVPESLKGKIVSDAKRKGAVLKSKLPRNPFKDDIVPTARHWSPSVSERAEFNKYVKGAGDASFALDAFIRGKMTITDREVLQSMHPELYEALKNTILDMVGKHKANGEYYTESQARNIRIFLGSNESYDPMAVMVLQNNFKPQPRKEPTRGLGRDTITLSKSLMPTTDKLSNQGR